MERNDALRVFVGNYDYVFVNNKLQQVRWLRTDFKYDHTEGNVDFYEAITLYEKPDGTTGTLKSYDRAFGSVEDYENGVPAKTSSHTISKDGAGCTILRDLVRGVKSAVSVEYWVFDELCHYPAKYTLKLEKFYYNYNDMHFHTDGFPKNCKIYDTKEQALSYNSYNVVRENGTVYQRDGVNKLVSLDDDQRELVNQFEELCHKMHEHDILLIGDYDSLAAFNLRNVEAHVLDYQDTPDVDFGNAEDYERVERYGKAFNVANPIEVWGEDNSLFVLRKSQENGTK